MNSSLYFTNFRSKSSEDFDNQFLIAHRSSSSGNFITERSNLVQIISHRKGFFCEESQTIEQTKDPCLRFVGIRSMQSIQASWEVDVVTTVAARVGSPEADMAFLIS